MTGYFTSEHFKLLDKWKGQKRDDSNPEQNRAYEELKKIKLFPTGVVKVRKRPTSQANFFLPYNGARIQPGTDSCPTQGH